MRTLFAAVAATGLFLVLLIGDIALRAMISGRIDPFFTSLATFSMDFAAIMFFGFVLQRYVLNRRTGTPLRAILAFILLIIISACAGFVRSEVRARTLDHVQTVVAERLVDARLLPVCNRLARELIDAEVFRYATDGVRATHSGWGEDIVAKCDIMSRINGNEGRRALYINILTANNMLQPDATLAPSDLMLSRSELGIFYGAAIFFAALSVGIFVWAVAEVVSSLRESDTPEATRRLAASAGGAQ